MDKRLTEKLNGQLKRSLTVALATAGALLAVSLWHRRRGTYLSGVPKNVIAPGETTVVPLPPPATPGANVSASPAE